MRVCFVVFWSAACGRGRLEDGTMVVLAEGSEPLLVLRGTLTTSRRRCGKPNCRCVSGEPRVSAVLRFTDGGRYRTVTLRPGDVPVVAAAVARYQQVCGELEEAADAGLVRLETMLAARRSGR